MNPNDESREDRRFAALFASIDSEAAPPDEQFLDALRERSTEVFVAESLKETPVSRRRHPMLVATYRIAAAATTAAVLVAAWLWSSTSWTS